jgi:hypothetical protein
VGTSSLSLRSIDLTMSKIIVVSDASQRIRQMTH